MPLHQWDPETGFADAQAGCFVHEAVDGEGEITPGETAGGDLLRLVHVGPYAEMGRSWKGVYERAGELGKQPGPGWEIYVDDPGQVDASDLRTEISLPVQ